ncbi:MAG: hypothetical protein ACI8S6_005283, partial [Myxococcota bacterium]
MSGWAQMTEESPTDRMAWRPKILSAVNYWMLVLGGGLLLIAMARGLFFKSELLHSP